MSVSLLVSIAPAASADLGRPYTPEAERMPAASPWSFTFTTYGWVPWLSGNMTIKGRTFDVQVDPIEMFEHLDWSTLPAWMSYAEARSGPISLFNDIVYANVSGSGGFAKAPPVWVKLCRAVFPSTTNKRSSNLGVLTKSGRASTRRYLAPPRSIFWRAGATGTRRWMSPVSLVCIPYRERLRDPDRSTGSIRLSVPDFASSFAPGTSLILRGDVGGFGAGSDFSWQVLATYNWQLCTFGGHLIDGYLGYRALSVDYSQGSGTTEYKYDVLMQGPVMGATLHF